MEKMSDVEMRCFSAVQHWQRQEILQRLKDSLTWWPAPLSLYRASLPTKIGKVLLILTLSPLILTAWLLRLVLVLLASPYWYLSTLAIPNRLYAPGERNIQGIHRAFSPYHNLSPPFYLRCMDDWVTILYGVEAARKNKIETHLFAQSSRRFLGHSEQPSRQHISLARESLSRALGYY